MKTLVTTRITWDKDGNVIEHECYEYDGAVAELKGDGTAKDQLKRDNALTDAQLARQNDLQDMIKAGVSKYLSGNEGYDPATLAAMNSSVLGQNAQRYGDARTAVMNALRQRGAGAGDLPTGGDYTRGLADLFGAQANDLAGGLQNVQLNNAQQALNNKFNAGSLLSGNAATLSSNVGNFNGGASSALGQYVNAANQGFGNAFTSAFGGSLGKMLGSAGTNAAGNAIGKIPGLG